MDTILSQLVTRFKETREVVENFFFFLNPVTLLNTETDIIIKSSYNFIKKYSHDISTKFTRKILSLKTVFGRHKLKTIKDLAI